MHFFGSRGLAGLVGAAAVIVSVTAAAQEPAGPDDKIKAACLVNFAGFVTWPSGTFAKPDSPIIIAVFGADPFGAALEQAAGTDTINGHPVVIARFSRLQEITPSHVLYVSRSENDRLPQLLRQRGVASALTVGETPQFTHRGGMIRFRMKGEQVQFEINAPAVQRAGLKISSKMLKLAIVVEPAEGPAKP